QWDEERGNNIPAPASQQEHAMDVSDTGRALRILPKNQRDAVILVAAGGLSYEDAAKLCGTRAPAIKSRVSRGRARLRTLVHGRESLAPRSAVRGGEVEQIARVGSPLPSAIMRRRQLVNTGGVGIK
ncbi:MAG TPA: sigma factor-like helix-turn-helix DNA-binding protein, partial [Xanthobacteraceae bacterium]|nr:sigma factor-like helix-turn-helix DNA-binding protein [Xanthobacteraceae bacterium]